MSNQSQFEVWKTCERAGVVKGNDGLGVPDWWRSSRGVGVESLGMMLNGGLSSRCLWLRYRGNVCPTPSASWGVRSLGVVWG